MKRDACILGVMEVSNALCGAFGQMACGVLCGRHTHTPTPSLTFIQLHISPMRKHRQAPPPSCCPRWWPPAGGARWRAPWGRWRRRQTGRRVLGGLVCCSVGWVVDEIQVLTPCLCPSHLNRPDQLTNSQHVHSPSTKPTTNTDRRPRLRAASSPPAAPTPTTTAPVIWWGWRRTR